MAVRGKWLVGGKSGNRETCCEVMAAHWAGSGFGGVNVLGMERVGEWGLYFGDSIKQAG